jgi:hypothetical protein
VRVLKSETVDLTFENHLKHPTMKSGLGGIVNGAGGYGWAARTARSSSWTTASAPSRSSWVQTQHYKAPTYPAFLALANEAAASPRQPGTMIGTPGKPWFGVWYEPAPAGN